MSRESPAQTPESPASPEVLYDHWQTAIFPWVRVARLAAIPLASMRPGAVISFERGMEPQFYWPRVMPVWPAVLGMLEAARDGGWG